MAVAGIDAGADPQRAGQGQIEVHAGCSGIDGPYGP